MPLIEPVTYPDMRTPQETAEVCEVIRELLRATGKVRTGLGAAREDVNVSVKGGTRVEIKGVPSIRRIPLLVYNEAMRQWSLLRIRELLDKRRITPKTFAARDYDVTRVLSKTLYHPIRDAVSLGKSVRCVVLEGFAGILKERTQNDTTFAKEVSDRVRVVACLTTLPNIAHSDVASESVSAESWKTIRQRVGAGPNDALVLVWGSREDVETASSEIVIRAREATEGVPSETRQALRDQTNGFERILPGPHRMYPDTDLPPIPLSRERVERARARLIEPPWERENRYRPLGLPVDILDDLLISPRYTLFDVLINELPTDPILAGRVLTCEAKALRRKGLDMGLLTDNEVFDIFQAHRDGRLAREGIIEVIRHMIGQKVGERPPSSGAAVQEALHALGYVPMETDEVETMVSKVVAEADLNAFGDFRSSHRYLMGRLMGHLRGRVDGKIVAKLLDNELSEKTGLRS
jgi:glutamyl-tRNA(Gln) amidotransferase subunit E